MQQGTQRLTYQTTQSRELNTVLASQVDWDKWVDEDEEDEAAPNKDFDMSDLQNFSNLGGGSFGAGLGGGMSGIGNVEVLSSTPACRLSLRLVLEGGSFLMSLLYLPATCCTPDHRAAL